MRTFICAMLIAWFSSAVIAASDTPAKSSAVRDVESVLNDWHDAAAKADFDRYFSHFDDNAVFLGTDATERWTTPEFKVFAKPRFDKHSAWTLIPNGRHVSISPDGNTAWFDERVDSPKYGLCRGSGVLVKSGRTWKITQYNYSLPIPNELFPQVVGMIAHPPSANSSHPAR